MHNIHNIETKTKEQTREDRKKKQTEKHINKATIKLTVICRVRIKQITANKVYANCACTNSIRSTRSDQEEKKNPVGGGEHEQYDSFGENGLYLVVCYYVRP